MIRAPCFYMVLILQMRGEDMPKDNRLTAEKLAVELCGEEGFEMEDVADFSEDMLTRF